MNSKDHECGSPRALKFSPKSLILTMRNSIILQGAADGAHLIDFIGNQDTRVKVKSIDSQ